MTIARIRQAFETALSTWAAAHNPVLPIAWQNIDTDPTERYLRVALLPNVMVSQDLTGSHRGYIGIFQVSICLPLNTGRGEADSICAEIDTLFPASTYITASGLRILILRPSSPGPAMVEDTHFVVPVSIEYRADT